MGEKEVGEVFTYFSKPSVAAITLSDTLRTGDKIRIKGHTTNFEQTVEKIQIDKEDVEEAKEGDKIGIKVSGRVRPNDKVFLIE